MAIQSQHQHLVILISLTKLSVLLVRHVMSLPPLPLPGVASVILNNTVNSDINFRIFNVMNGLKHTHIP